VKEGEERINPLHLPPHHNPETTHLNLPSSIWCYDFALKTPARFNPNKEEINGGLVTRTKTKHHNFK